MTTLTRIILILLTALGTTMPAARADTLPNATLAERTIVHSALYDFVQRYNDDGDVTWSLNQHTTAFSGRRSDGTCGETTGYRAVSRDLAFNAKRLRGRRFKLYGVDAPHAWGRLQDGGLRSRGLTYAIGSGQRRPISIQFNVDYTNDRAGETRVSSVAMAC